MKVSLNIVKQYTEVPLSVPELVAKINGQLGGVEATVDLAYSYKDAVIARVIECQKHDNADKLSVCMIDAGQSEPVQVVCGAPNVRNGLLVVWLPPGSAVPATVADAEPFVLEARELRGVISHGMLASAKELGIGDDHDGILEIDPTEWKPSSVEIKPGTSFAKAYELDDVIIDIENKMFTHRPDLFGQLGVAREIAGIQQKAFSSPDWCKASVAIDGGEGVELSVSNDASEKVPRFMAVAIDGVAVKQSPLWLRIALVRLGGKPINNIVDATNYVMLLTGQPLHAYDYDKLAGFTLGVRFASAGESVTLLNNKTYSLDTDDIVIVDGKAPVGLGGVMGGAHSEVSDDTTRIVIECATFDMYAVRKTSMRHGLFTDAVTRFNKGQSPLQNAAVLGLAIQTIIDTAGGAVASEVFDYHEALPELTTITVSAGFINERLGLELSPGDIRRLLQNVECTVVESKDGLTITAPFWRTDLESQEDIVEEVGRLYGFDKLPRELPWRSLQPAPQNHMLLMKDTVRHSLARSGASEVLTYSFVHENILKKAEQDTSQAFRLSNALSPDLQYYRLSVLPSLLDKVHANIKSGHDEFALFEIGKGHSTQSIDSDGLPKEANLVELVYARKKNSLGAPYYTAQRIVRKLASDLGVEVSLHVVDGLTEYPGIMMFDLSRSALIKSGETTLGMVGELKQSVIKRFKLPAYVAAATLDFEALAAQHQTSVSSYTPLPRFPKVTQDISLRVAVDVPYKAVYELVASAVMSTDGQYLTTLMPLSIYRAQETDTKTITLRLTVASYEKTLTDNDVSAMLEAAAQSAASVGAKRI